MEDAKKDLLPKLINAVKLMMAATTPQAQRYEAYQACEDFKENSPFCAQFGFLMADKSHTHIIRHFGLQLLEHSVKYKWNQMSAEDKCFIKNNTIKLMAEGTYGIFEEQTHIKDGLSRVMVEMIKREWPQQYPDMLAEFDKLCTLGATQTELVLLIFLRLAEDVLLFQTVPSQRRREIMTGLTMHMQSIYSFFINTLSNSFQSYQKLKGVPAEQVQAQQYCKVAAAVLETLCAYVDWLSGTYVFDGNGTLLCMLCAMLQDASLQLPAVECLLVIANRKGKVEERRPLLVLFSEEAMSAILNAVCVAGTADLEEHHYLFLKKLCQVLTAIGAQLAAMWGTPSGANSEMIGQPATFSKYLEAILAFTQHPSQFLGSITQTLWASLLRHEHISKDPVFKDQYIPKLVATTKQTLLKVGFPSQSNSRSCAYCALDFDSDEDFSMFFSKYRAEVAETIRLCTMISPLVTFLFAETWLRSALSIPIDSGKPPHDADSELCNLSSPSLLEWDALSVYLECVMQRLERVPDAEKPPSDSGIQLLQAVLAFNTRDPLIYSCLLSCISALFPYLNYAPSVLPTILDKIFSAAVFALEGQTKGTRSRAVRNVRRHACSVLVKICKQYPSLLFPGLDTLYTHIKKLSLDPEELSNLEKTTLLEALVLISNEFKNYREQSEFVAEIMAPVREMWLSTHVKEALWSAQKFMSYVGVDQAPVEPSSADTCGINRSHLLFCSNVIHGMLKRCVWPSNQQQAHEGGFVLRTEGGKPVYRNPATPQLLQLMENVLACTRTMNEIWLAEHIVRRHPEFTKAYEMMETEKQVILGIHPPCVDNSDSTTNKQPLERMQSFVTSFHDTLYHILGNAGQSLGVEFYQAPHLAQSIANSVFTNLDHIPDYRLKTVVRAFLKPFALHCPKEYYEPVLLPILECICPFMLQRLTKKWQTVCRDIDSGDADDRDPESEEVLQEQLLRQLTREYLEFLGYMLKEKKDSSSDEHMEEEAPQALHPRELSFSDLGKLLLQSPNLYPSIVITIFTSLTWPDTASCNKSIGYCFPVLKQLVQGERITSEDACHVYTNILHSLQLQGQHEGQQAMLLSLGLQVYEFLRSRYSEVTQVMLQIPNCTPQALHAFDEKILNVSPQKQIPEKRKKDSYKKLVSEIIGKNVGQQFKKEAKIRNLPPIVKATRPKSAALLESEARDLGICSLFSHDDNDDV